MFSSSHGFFGVQAGGSGTVPANVLTTPDIVTNVDDAAQAGRLITVAKAKELLGTPAEPAQAVVVGETPASLPAPAAGNSGQLYILRTAAADVTYRSSGAAWTVEPDPDVGTECYITQINAAITWDGARWGDGSIVPEQQRTLAADENIDTRFATRWRLDPGGANRTITLQGSAPEVVLENEGYDILTILPSATTGGLPLELRGLERGTAILTDTGGYRWAR